MMCHIKWHIIKRLRNGNHMFTQCMSNSRFVHYVWILAREIDNNYMGAKNKVENILNYRAFFPNVINPKTPVASSTASTANTIMH